MADFQPLQELERLLGQSAGTPSALFPANSRYQTTPLGTLEEADGTKIAYLLRRFVPQPEAFAISGEVTVGEGDRLDNLTARLLGDPELFWRMCDANRALRPDELEVVHRHLRIPLPQAIPSPKANG